MNLTRLRYFVVTAEEENVGRAARRLHVAQPALSRQLRSLEREVGTPLLERHARGVRLLPAGETFLEYARRLLADAKAAVAAARRTAEDVRRRTQLRIAPPDWPHRALWVADAVGRFGRLRPDVVVEFDATPWHLHATAVGEGSVDIGFGIAMSAADFGAGIAAERLCDEPGSSAILPAAHPLAQRTSVTLAELRTLPLLVPPRELAPVPHEMMAAAVRRGGYEPRLRSASPSFAATVQLVVAGAGWIISVNSTGEVPPPGTAVVPIADARIMLGFFLLRRRDDECPAVHAFGQCVREVVASA